jgi:hypothetical protein
MFSWYTLHFRHILQKRGVSWGCRGVVDIFLSLQNNSPIDSSYPLNLPD